MRQFISDRIVGRLLKAWRGDGLVRGFGVLGLGEMFIRVSRIVTAIVLARFLDPIELGIAATAITCFEIVRVLANNGLGQMVMRAREEDLARTCNAAWAWMWATCMAMIIVQVCAGWALAHLAGRPELFAMIAWLSGVYLVMPFSMVQAWLLQRAKRMGTLAAINTTQVSIDNLLTAALAFAGLGPWAIVAPKFITAPIWLIGMRRAVTWQRDRSAGMLGPREVWRFCAPVLASEVLSAVRLNADKSLVGAILGLEALGIYYFAFSAGYGLSLVLTNALASASFPHLAEANTSARALVARFDGILKRLAAPIGLLIVLQAIAVFVYVPLLFGVKWEPYTAIVATLALSAATKPCYDVSAHLLRAAGLPTGELVGSLVFTIAYMGVFAAFLPFGLAIGVAALSLTTIVTQLLFAAYARRLVLAQRRDNGVAPELAASTAQA